MKFFIDTANLEEIKAAAAMGVLDGVTTNPSLIAKEGRDFEEIIRDICAIVDGPISAEVIALDTEGMVSEARHLAKIHENIVIKIPMTVDGLKACRTLTDEGIKTNVTLVFSPLQALMAELVTASTGHMPSSMTNTGFSCHSPRRKVSRVTSSSWTSLLEPHLVQAVGSSWATMSSPHSSQVQAGMRWPHQICREIHQSWMLRIHSK